MEFQLIPSVGLGIIFTTTLPSTLAPLEEKDVAVATAMYSFIRSFGLVWGVTMAGIVFNGQVNVFLNLVSNDRLRNLLRNGAAYAFAASKGGLHTIKDQDSLVQVIQVYVKALRVFWLVAMAVSLLGLICIPFEKCLELKQDHTTEYGLEEKS